MPTIASEIAPSEASKITSTKVSGIAPTKASEIAPSEASEIEVSEIAPTECTCSEIAPNDASDIFFHTSHLGFSQPTISTCYLMPFHSIVDIATESQSDVLLTQECMRPVVESNQRCREYELMVSGMQSLAFDLRNVQ